MTSRIKRLAAGDTIVEVMVAIVVAGVALAVAYQLSNASLRTSTQSSQRSQALAVSSAQIERLKSVFTGNESGFITMFESNPSDFCTDPAGAYYQYSSSGSYCNNIEGSIFSVDDHYDQTSGTFSITTTWDNINGHGKDQQVLYYRFPQ